jgi:tetratricopeptide (TPR) repeat protein
VFGRDTISVEKVLLSEQDSPYVWVAEQMGRAFRDYDERNDFVAFDQKAKQIILAAENTYDTDLILKSHQLYLDFSPENNLSDQLISSIERTEDLILRHNDKKLMLNGLISITEAALNSMIANPSLGEIALKNVLRAKSESTRYEDPGVDIRLGLLLGEILLNQNKTEEAYQELLAVKTMVQQIDDDEQKKRLEFDLNGILFKFFSSINDWDEAGKYKYQQIERLKKVKGDSLLLMWHYYELATMSKVSGRTLENPEQLRVILNFADRNKNERLKQWTLALYREHLIQQNEYEGLKRLYEQEYPQDLAVLKNTQPILHCMILGFMCEQEEMQDSAYQYYNRAEELLSQDKRKHFASVQYRRLGTIHERHGNLERASEYLEKAFQLAEEVSNEKFALEALEQLETLMIRMGNYKDAYLYANKKVKLEESVLNWEKQQAIMRMSFSNEQVLEQIKQQKKVEQKKQRYARQNWLIAIILALAIIAMMMMTRVPVAEWVVEMMAFFTILCLFEFVILTIDHELHDLTGGAPLPMFGAKVALLSILFPLHHVIENGVINYMKKRHRLKDPEDTASFTVKRTIRKGLATIWPWLSSKDDNE